jgi:two-component system response regulator FixJ
MAAVLVGKMNKIIAYELNITTRTVEMHRSHLMEKMGAKCLADLLRFAQELDLLHGNP